MDALGIIGITCLGISWICLMSVFTQDFTTEETVSLLAWIGFSIIGMSLIILEKINNLIKVFTTAKQFFPAKEALKETNNKTEVLSSYDDDDDYDDWDD